MSDEEITNQVQEEYPIALDLHNPIHNTLKRNTATTSSTNSANTSSEGVHTRKKRYANGNFDSEDEDDFEENRPSEYFIKVLVVADRSMLDFYKTKEELNHYILTLMSQTTRLFKDPSIGNAISVSVIEIKILEKQVFEVSDSQETLAKFCKWREKYTVHTNHDVALLLTRHDFCKYKDQECVTVGVARVGAMCTASSCAVAVDKGLPTTYTIAHEIGHALNMPHDVDDKGRCANLNKGESEKYIMTPSLEKDIKPWMWSPCSKYFVTEFLGSKRSRCLLKRPTTNFISTEVANIPPGEKYEVKKQCEFEFGEGKDHCLYENEPPCLHLWCTANPNEGCSTHHMPWAEGTYCGPEKWCHNGECITFKENDLKPVPGGWGLWSEWGECSRTCGGGIKMSQRQCDNPVPENGGDYCFGQSIRYASCNTEACPDNTDFRAVQCAAFDGNNIDMKNLPKDIKWLPKYGLEKEDQCKLYCRPQHSNAYYMLKSKVLDGTKCGFNSFGICVDGKCRSGGCDNKLQSKMELDDCGICGGDNSQCEEISGSYNITATSAGYNSIMKFPKGSSSLDIKQRDRKDEKFRSYLSLVDGDTKKYILNGNNVITEQQKDIIFGGSVIKYSGSKSLVERITTAKNEILTKDLILNILTIDSRSPPPDVTYRYIISKANAPSYLWYTSQIRNLKKPKVRPPRYSWMLYQKEWSKCNSICSGFQFMKPVCIELGNNEQVVEDYYCASKETHGIIQKKECNNHCRLIWNPIKRGDCSVTCGTGIRTVSYNCMKIDNEREKYGFLQIITADTYGDVVDDVYCNVLPTPEYTEPCTGSCHVRWHYSDWSQCSQTCGGGIQTRTARCVHTLNGVPLEAEDCKELSKITQRECKNNKCPEWFAFEWSQCSAQCGEGYKSRTVRCRVGDDYYKEHFCDQRTKPKDRMHCEMKPCVGWSSGEWSICSATCGNGIQIREVYCQSRDDYSVMDLEKCSDLLKPNSTKICHMRKCSHYTKISEPRYSFPEDLTNNSVQIDFRSVEGKWMTGSWTPCSKSCGGGYSSRRVTCKGGYPGRSCDIHHKPVTRTNCNTFRCPQWKTGGWSQCDENCEKHRLVICQNDTGTTTSEFQCSSKDKPNKSAKCRLSQCPHLTNTVPRQYFDSVEDNSGRYRWKVGKWKECSAKCGNGFKTRNVTCHKVYPGGLIDPNPMPALRYNRYRRNYCEMFRKPLDTSRCKESNCSDDYVWRPARWSECSQKCGRKGRQTRKLLCVNSSTGVPVNRRLCPRNFKPKRKRKCNQWKCAHNSCMHVKYTLRTRENKDYLLDLNGKRAIVYCFKMDTPEPEEYISLMSDHQNYAEIYDKRLVNRNSCPYNGERNDDCDCVSVGPERSGLTKFYKIRLNITTMRIIGEDFTFSSQVRGKRIPYGTAGDCYSNAEGCGQGRFSIDLIGTSFKLSNEVTWIGATTKIHKTDKSAMGKCGGYCGDCVPDPNTGLQVEVT
ncbi:hypothetical protein WA026_016725 [Henosepilachna vigintioctopunctata]|uniref:A disintegrin and metalloproteinase with thrombospondin motifs 9 n=1 Tax=Henosepilachna vigintioctopunctata TaxID=420089 RepID=A0AAW1V2D5_9CUCU